ncbi:hypothetical protein HMPREF2758_03400 [Facklamia sp. HMSC062C11]|uniref:hypothetical protein n=1 Tax=Facklamia sp. HMSC062C11 TaxID=1739262 RepID=UPI0008A4D1ED|nr:hypothetical protein [Facklamia sp. HMSC062C11]OFL64636.1 hypothetical protein HMPREF2758_03400 [Facklamia sp. HMSC062C11]
MASVKQILSGLSTGFMAALLAGALMSYWVWLEMRIHTWVLCWLILALFIMISVFFKIKPLLFFILEAVIVVLVFVKSPNIFIYNVRDMFFLDMPFDQIKWLTLTIVAVLNIIMLYLLSEQRKKA